MSVTWTKVLSRWNWIHFPVLYLQQILLVCNYILFTSLKRVWRYQRATRIRKSKNNRQHNGQKKKDKKTNNGLQNIHTKLSFKYTPSLTIWLCDLYLWPWKSIGFQTLLRTKYVPSLVKIHWRMLILECSQGCNAVTIWPGDLDLWPMTLQINRVPDFLKD
jgi:hypothetical protein